MYACIHGRCNPNLKLVPCSSNNNNTRLTIWPRACRELVFPRDPSPFPRWQRGLCPLACPPRQSGAGAHYIVTCRGLGGLGPGSELKTSGTQQRTPRFTLDARAWQGRKRESTRRGRGKGRGSPLHPVPGTAHLPGSANLTSLSRPSRGSSCRRSLRSTVSLPRRRTTPPRSV